jgi:hypothetical protein
LELDRAIHWHAQLGDVQTQRWKPKRLSTRLFFGLEHGDTVPETRGVRVGSQERP